MRESLPAGPTHVLPSACVKFSLCIVLPGGGRKRENLQIVLLCRTFAEGGSERTPLKCFGLAGGEEMGTREVEVEVKRCQGNHFFRCNQRENCPSRVPQEEKAGQDGVRLGCC